MRTTTTIICSHPDSELNQPLRIEITSDDRSGFFQTNARVCGVERGSREEQVIDDNTTSEIALDQVIVPQPDFIDTYPLSRDKQDDCSPPTIRLISYWNRS